MVRPNFFYLLIGLLVFLTAIPVTDDLGILNTPAVRILVFSGLLAIGVWSLKGGGAFFKAGMGFVVVGIFLSVLAANTESTLVQFSSLIALIGFFGVAITFTLIKVAVGTDIDANRIAGAICVYLLLGLIWAMGYALLEMAVPGSFSGFSSLDDSGFSSEWVYFSFVTITTLGYGDLLPVSATARALSQTEAVVGQFYLAILVAGLVGAYISGKTDR